MNRVEAMQCLLLVGSWLGGIQLAAQTGQSSTPAIAQNETARAPSVVDPIASLSAEQQAAFKTALEGQRYGDSLPLFRQLLSRVPASSPATIYISKFAAEAALNTGDRGFAERTLKPIVLANSDDWQAASLLARFYAESGNKQQRDQELTHLIELHTQAKMKQPQSQIAQLNQVLLEGIALEGGGVIKVWYSLEPWGRYKTYIFSRIYDKGGQEVLRVALESNDFDQPGFGKEHPDLIEKGKRRFFLDGYGITQVAANGTATHTHMTYGFFDGQPEYDLVRERVMDIARKQTLAVTVLTQHEAK